MMVFLAWIAAAIVGLVLALVTLVDVLEAGTTTYGVGIGADPMLLGAGILSAVTVLSASPLGLLGAAVAVCAAVVNLASLSRNQIVTGVVAVAGCVALARGSRVRLGVTLLAATAIVLTGVRLFLPEVAAEGGKLSRLVAGSVSDRGADVRTADQRSATDERADDAPPVGSFSQRVTEAEDSVGALWSAAPLTLITGRGAGALYRSRLDPDQTQGVPAGQRHHIHITWVSVLYRHGILGLIAVLVVVGGVLVAAVRLCRRVEGPGERLVAGSLLIWLAVGAMGAFFAYGVLGELKWAVALGLVSAMTRLQGARQADRFGARADPGLAKP